MCFRSYESFVALPASPVSASVHPALPPLTAVDRCIFYLKAIVCVACDLRDNEALRSDDPETNPAFAAESANAVFLEAIKHIDNHGEVRHDPMHVSVRAEVRTFTSGMCSLLPGLLLSTREHRMRAPTTRAERHTRQREDGTALNVIDLGEGTDRLTGVVRLDRGRVFFISCNKRSRAGCTRKVA